MVNQLNSLISGTIRRPIIVNGKLVKHGKQTLYVRRDGYKIVCLVKEGANQESIISNGDDLLQQTGNEFNQKYGVMGRNDKDLLANFSASVDAFTGAIVLKNGLYNMILDKSDTLHLHDGRAQFTEDVQTLITDFELELMADYFELYVTLLNRRLTSSHIPMKIKGHLVAGLYQPLVVQTRHIDCPLRLSKFDWFFNSLNSPVRREESLENVNETSRGLELSVISMFDLHEKYDTPLVRELNRIHFTYILYMILMGCVKDHGATGLAVRNYSLYEALREGRAGVPGTRDFLVAFSDGVKKSRQGLVARR